MTDIFTTSEQERVVQAISVAESKTSGEIRLVVDQKVAGASVIEAAVHYFRKLDMDKTVLKNGVLIYLAVEDHEFAIIGDSGINTKVEEDFWNETKEQMAVFFKAGSLVDGLVAGIHHAGEQLQRFFPSRPDDVNELPDDIYFGKN